LSGAAIFIRAGREQGRSLRQRTTLVAQPIGMLSIGSAIAA